MRIFFIIKKFWLYLFLALGCRRFKKVLKNYGKFPDTEPIDYRFKVVARQTKRYLKANRVSYKIIGANNIPNRPVLIVPNHQHNIDPLLLITFFQTNENWKKPLFIAKKEILMGKKAIVRGCRLIDAQFLDRENLRDTVKVLEKARQLIKDGRSVVVFPEGTRSPKEVGSYKAGALKIAYKAYCPILPVTIVNSGDFTNKCRKLIVKIIIHPPLDPHSFHSKTSIHLAQDLESQARETCQKFRDKK